MPPPEEKHSWLERPLSSLFPALTLEVALFAVILVLAAISRLYGLGTRVMSHDESLHTYFSWLLYNGGGYQHNPMMHGPLQFHLLALTYFLLGVSDFTARFPHALSSIATILVLWKWRRYLGRAGTLTAAALMLISPYMLYYGRYARNETFVGLFGVLTLYALLRYLETGRPRYIYLLTAATVLHFTAKETAFIYTAQALLFLAILFIARVTRQPWARANRYTGFVIALAAGVLLTGAAIGYGLYGHKQPLLSATETAPPLVPGQPTSPFAPAATFAISPTVILVIIALLAFVVAGYFLITGYGWKMIRAERTFDLLMLLGTLVLPLLVAFPIKSVGWNPLDYTFNATTWDLRALLQQGIVRTAIFFFPILAISIGLGLWWNAKLWLKNAAVFYTIFIVLYTTVFTNGGGFFTGMIGSLGYWLEQQGVERGSQPWYYYILVQIPLYEFLPALGIWPALYFGLRKRRPAPLPHPETGAADAPAEQEEPANLTFALLAWWSISSLLTFTLAGEKMPWLTCHITWPMILFSGWAIGQLIERTDWGHVRRQRGALVVALLIVFLAASFGMLASAIGTTPPFQGKELAQLQATASFMLSALTTIGSGTGLFYLLSGWDIRHFLRLAALTIFALLAVLTARTAIRAAYINYDYGTEYLVYAHGERGIKDIMVQVDELSERIAGGKTMIVAYDVSAPDTGVSWPFSWYLRDYTNLRPFDQPSRSLREAPVIIVDQKNFAKIEPVVGQAYYRFDYLRMVWPNQDYFGLTWERILNALRTPEIRAGIFDIWFNRDYRLYAQAVHSNSMELTTWDPSDKMRLYIRKDIAAQIWNYGVGPTTEIVADPYEQGTIHLAADLTIGVPGQAEGQFQSPRAIAIAPDGSIYVADSRNHRIQRFAADGTLISAWGTFADYRTGTAPLGTFFEPWGVAVSPDGAWVYVTDTWNHRVQKFTADGRPVTALGYGKYGLDADPLGFWGPRGIAVDSNGRVFVADTGNKRIVIFDSNGNYLAQFGTPGMEPGQFDEPVGIAIDATGNVYVADTWNQRVQVFAPSEDGLSYVPLVNWEIFGWYGQSLDNKPFIAVDAQGNVFVTDPEAYRVLEFTAQGEFVRAWGDPGTGPENISLASGIAVDAQGRIWVSDAGNNRLMRFTLPVAAVLPPPSPPVQSPSPSPSPTEAVTATAETCMVFTGYPNGWLTLRNCASIECRPLGWLPEGMVLTILPTPTVDPWLPVQTDGLTGWVYSRYCVELPSE